MKILLAVDGSAYSDAAVEERWAQYPAPWSIMQSVLLKLCASHKTENPTRHYKSKRLCPKSRHTALLCATSVFSVSLVVEYCLEKTTTETQRTQRLHREEVKQEAFRAKPVEAEVNSRSDLGVDGLPAEGADLQCRIA